MIHQAFEERKAEDSLIETDINHRVFLINWGEGREDAQFLTDVVLPKIRHQKLQGVFLVEIGDFGRFSWFLPLVLFIVDKIDHPIAFPADQRAVDQGFAPTPNRGFVNERHMDDIQLVFNRPGVVDAPDLLKLPIRKAFFQLLKERNLGCCLFLVPIPNKNQASFFFREIRGNLEISGNGGVFSVRGNHHDFAILIIFKTMERALDMVMEEFALG